MKNLKYIIKAYRYIGANPWVLKYLGTSILLHFVLFGLILCLLSITSISIFSGLNSQTNLNLNTNVVSIASGLFGLLIGGLLIFVLYTFLSSIVNSVVYSQMVPKIYKDIYKEELPYRSILQDLISSIIYELKKTVIILSILILTFFINLIPVIGSGAYIVLNIIQIIVITGLDMFEPSLMKYNLRFRDKVKRIVRDPKELWIFLGVVGFLGSIPILNIFLIPIFVIASTFVAKENLINEKNKS